MNPEWCVRILQGLINYHERMLLGDVYCKTGDNEVKCLANRMYDPFKEALQEAVRCVRKVHQLSDIDC